MHSLIIDFLIFSACACIFVPIFQHLKLGSILAYLFAGVLIGPHILGFIKEPELILHFSELGVVILLFIIGLELAPAKLWNMRKHIFGMGLLQVLITASIFILIAHKLVHLKIEESIIIGFALALSSTAFGIQLLEEKKQLNLNHGKGSFAILMFQDLAVVPVLALVNILASEKEFSVSWMQFGKTLFAILLVFIIGHFIIRYVFKFIARGRSQEVFVAFSLFLVLGAALLFESSGMSLGMGAFMAGILLAESEFRHEIERNLLPFKGLLLGLFFIAVGMSLNLKLVLEQPHKVILIAFLIIAVKASILYLLARLFRFSNSSARNIAFTIAQGGEFAFVIFSAAVAQKLVDQNSVSMINAAIILSMALTPLLFNWNRNSLLKSANEADQEFETDSIEGGKKVIIVGFGRVGQIIARFLNGEKIEYTILDHSIDQINIARRFENKVYYGDATDYEILKAAGIENATSFVLAIGEMETSVKIAKLVREKHPKITIVARARNRQHVIDLQELGVEILQRETLLASLEMAKQLLITLGYKREKINPRLAKFREHDDKILAEQFKLRHDQKKFISYTTQANKELEQILQADLDNN